MNENEEGGIATRILEMVVALAFVAVGAVVISDSIRVGNDWGDDGPKAGYFPFYIGCILAVCGAIVLGQTVMKWRSDALNKPFASYGELRLVLAMLIPTVVYVLGVTLLGIYISSGIFIALFMVWQGKYHWGKAVAVGLSVPLVLFLLFEKWFLVSLPKSPLGLF